MDIHTHYDGHAIWEDRLNPSSFHGVTTVVMGNCGVGFAPCKPHDRDRLVSLMEGVEDVPEVVMTSGLTWDWERFPEYLDRLGERTYDMDVAAYLPHAPLRVFVMGKRATARDPATPEDVAVMRTIAREAIAAGALGFSTSRTLNHRARDGWLTPSYAAGERELTGIAAGLADAGSGVLQLISDFDTVEPEFAMLQRVAQSSGRPLSISLMQQSHAPERWKSVLQLIDRANSDGIEVTAQVAPRPVGAILGLEAFHNPFSFCPAYGAIEDLSFGERLQAMRDPEVRRRLVSEFPEAVSGKRASYWRLENMYPMADRPDYEPLAGDSIAGQAKNLGISPVEHAYDLTIAEGGKRMIYMPTSNYVGGKIDAVRTMLANPHTLIGLGDGGAHCSSICDASFQTYAMSRWAKGDDGLTMAQVVGKLTWNNAKFMRLADRGLLKPGMRADINVINPDEVGLFAPEMVYDLPTGRGRLRQRASGYDLTIVAGVPTYRDGLATDELPGRLVRGSGYRR